MLFIQTVQSGAREPIEPPPVNPCGNNFSTAYVILLDDSVECQFKVAGEKDYVVYFTDEDTDILIYSTDKLDMSVNVYLYPDLSNPIMTSDTLSTQGDFYTDFNNFFVELYVESGNTYYFEIEYSGFFIPNLYDVIIEDCKCVGSPADYISGHHAVEVFYGDYYFINYKLDDTIFDSAVTNAVSMWNRLGIVNFNEVLYSSETIYIVDSPIDPTSSGGIVLGDYSQYYKRIRINTDVYNSSNANVYYLVLVVAHELGHSLGINMEGTDYTGGETPMNFMPYGFYQVHSTGPCDKDTYRELYENGKWDD